MSIDTRRCVFQLRSANLMFMHFFLDLDSWDIDTVCCHSAPNGRPLLFMFPIDGSIPLPDHLVGPARFEPLQH